MTDPASTGAVVGAIQALSKPIEKLVDAISVGVGRLYEPTNIRRTARAEADRLVILANSAMQVSDIQRRAAERWLSVETRRQENIEAIALEAEKALPEKVDDAPVNRDWIARFFDECKDVSDEDMRRLWGKLLAGEVTMPGTFSVRTLRVLSGLSLSEASLFDRICPLVVDVQSGALFIHGDREEFLREKGFPYSERVALEGAGLLHQLVGSTFMKGALPGPNHLASASRNPAIFALSTNIPASSSIPLGSVILTQEGRELYKLWGGTADVEHLESAVAYLAPRGWMAGIGQPAIAPNGEPTWEMPRSIQEYIEALQQVIRRASSYLSPLSGGHRPFIVMRFERSDECFALRVQRDRSNGFPVARCA